MKLNKKKMINSLTSFQLIMRPIQLVLYVECVTFHAQCHNKPIVAPILIFGTTLVAQRATNIFQMIIDSLSMTYNK